MTREEAMNIIRKERACVIRAEVCNRDCGRCDLVIKTEDIIEAYDMAIFALMKGKSDGKQPDMA